MSMHPVGLRRHGLRATELGVLESHQADDARRHRGRQPDPVDVNLIGNDDIDLVRQRRANRARSPAPRRRHAPWRSMRIGPSFIKIGKAVLYLLEELNRWDRRNLVTCRPSRSLPIEEAVM